MIQFLVFQLENENIFLFSISRKLSNNEDNRRRSIRSAVYNRYLWIRTALIHRSLYKIVEYIVNNSSYVYHNQLVSFLIYFFVRKYYESYGLVANSVQGPIFSSLLGKLRYIILKFAL